MPKEEKAKIIANTLSENGFRPRIDEDNDILFKNEDTMLLITTYDNDDTYYSMLGMIDEKGKGKRERAAVLQACNDITSRYKVIKSYYTDESIVFKFEGFYQTPEAFAFALPRAVNVIKAAIIEFKDQREGNKQKPKGE